MKRIYIYLLSAIASLAFVPAVSAQTIADVIGEDTYNSFPQVSYTINKNVALSKQVSSPTADGTYWIKLEAFATGSASIITNSTPSDVLLVLDLSNSMVDNKYPVNSSTTRLEALQTACKAFIGSLYDNAVAASAAAEAAGSNYDGNRVGIVTFHGGSYDGVGATDITGEWLDVEDNVTKSGSVYSGNLISLINNLSVNTKKKGTHTHTGLYYAIENYLDHDGKAAVAGTNNYTLEDRANDYARENANLTVVIFTDGNPAGGSAYIGGQNQSTFNNYIANTAVNYANQLKKTYEAKVFSVALLGDESSDNVLQFIEYLSSNYPDADATAQSTTAWAGAVTPGASNTDGVAYFQNADDSDLTSIFEAIASQSGGASNTSLTSATTAVDIVSASFMLPTGATGDNIKVFTAKCTYADPDTQSYTFDTEIQAPNSPDKYRIWTSSTTSTEIDVDNEISVALDAANNKISVTGFDYSNNWCGPVTSGSSTTYQGHKVIILIPIKMNPDAVGGPSVRTNVEGSGIFVNGTDSDPLVEFEFPTVSLPVNIYVEKSGLANGESAKFIIEKAILPESGNPAEVAEDDWSYVTSVFVTEGTNAKRSGNNNPIVKIKGLPPTTMVGSEQKGLVYRIREEGWSWSYTYSPDPQYTVDVDNPFLFTNTRKENIDIKVRHAESKATNIFKPKTEGSTTGDIKYDDSKNNGR